MTPRIRSGDLVKLEPADPAQVEVGQIVLARVQGVLRLHLVSAIDTPRQRVQISNNHGHVNGWTSWAKVFGVCVAIGEDAKL